MPSKMRAGLIGAGRIARQHHLPHWLERGDVEFVGVADPSPEARQAVQAAFPGTPVFASAAELLDRRPAAVDVCTPSAFHAASVAEALAAGAHVLCEKPLGVSADEVRRLGEQADRANLLLMSAQMLRYDPRSAAARRLLREEGLGGLFHVKAEQVRRCGVSPLPSFLDPKLAGGGCLLDLGVHILDLAFWLLGFPRVVQVAGNASRRSGHRPGFPSHLGIWGGWNAADFQVEDFAAAFVRFEGGLTLSLETSYILAGPDHLRKSCQFFGDDGWLDWETGRTIRTGAQGWDERKLDATSPTQTQTPYALEIADFCDAVREGRPSPVPWRETHAVLSVIDAVYAQSTLPGRPLPSS